MFKCLQMFALTNRNSLPSLMELGLEQDSLRGNQRSFTEHGTLLNTLYGLQGNVCNSENK